MNITITQTLRPIKLAFLVKPSDKNSLRRAIQISSSLWGGKHFPILPYFKKFTQTFKEEYQIFVETPDEFYSNSLSNFDCDIIVADNDIHNQAVRFINFDRRVVSLDEVEESILLGKSKFGIGLIEILNLIRDTEFKYKRTDELRVCCPSMQKNEMLAAVMCGDIHPKLLSQIKGTKFPSEYISFPEIKDGDLKNCKNDSTLDYLGLSTYKTYTFGNPIWTSAFAVYILDPKSYYDLVNLWNYRALGWNILAIPIGELDNEFYKTQIIKQRAEFLESGALTHHISVLFSRGIDNETAHDYIRKIEKIKASFVSGSLSYALHWWRPRFWLQRKNLSYDKTAPVYLQSDRKQTILSAETEKVQLPIIRHPFESIYIPHAEPRFVNEIFVEFDETEGKYAQVLPTLNNRDLEYIIRGSGYRQWVFSKGSMHFCANEIDQYLSFAVPKASEVFTKWFEDRGYSIRDSAPGKLASQLLRNIGGIYGTNFLSNRGIPAVLSLFENGKTVLNTTLDNTINKHLNDFRELNIQAIKLRLLDKRIIEFGAQVQCTFCNKHSFYKVQELSEAVKCRICQNSFQIPTYNPKEIKWAYKGMGPFTQNNKAEGLLCVLMTLRFFRIPMHPSLVTPHLNFEILRNSIPENEVDLGLFFTKYRHGADPVDVLFCECKTENEFQRNDIEKLRVLGKQFPGAILTLATLKDSFSAAEKKLIKGLANTFRNRISSRPTCPVLLLTRNELMPIDRFMPFEKIDQKFVAHMRFQDEIGHIADVTCQIYADMPSFSSVVEKKMDEQTKNRSRKKES